MKRRLARRAPGLRGQVSAMFALGALALSLFLGGSTALLFHQIVLEQREGTTTRQADINARIVQDVLLTSNPDVTEALQNLDRPITSYSLLHADGRWHSSRPTVDETVLPARLRDGTRSGERTSEHLRLATGPSLVRTVALEDAEATYVEVFSLTDITQTERTLMVVLLGAGTVTTLLGAAVGRWAATTALRPVGALTTAAAAVATGDLTARVVPSQARDLHALGEAFNRTVENLQRRVERDSRFAANVAHELRSPLTTMINAVELLSARRSALPPATREVVDLLTQEVHRFDRTVADLLEISTASEASFHAEPVRLAELVRRAADATAGRSVTTVRPGAADAVVLGDKRRLERVMVNLVGNAEQHGGGTTRVTVDRTGSHARIVVEDRGPGVPPDQRELIFERFARAGTRPRTDGAGLGLALVAEHVRRHDGHIWVEAARDGGARFTVELPLVPSPEDATPQAGDD